jgi:hypothetical protein
MNRFWWIHPGKLLLFFLVPIYTFVVLVVPVTSPELIVLKAGSYASGPYAVFGLAVLVAMGVCAMIGASVSIDARQEGSSISVNPKLLATFGSIAIIAYLIWFYPAILHGNFSAGDRAALNQTPGVTSFTQLGVPFVVAYLNGRLLEGRNFGSLVRFQFRMILFLTLVRVQLWSERLALIEVVVPMAILLFTHRLPQTSFGKNFYRVVGAFGPFLAIPLLLLVFTITEFFRSWTTYSKTQNLPLLDFMTSRLVTYYFTAINNGIGMLVTQEGRWPTYDFNYTAEWLYHLPLGIGNAVHDLAVQNGGTDNEFLLRYADVEFNNMSGIFPIIYDLGHVGGILYFCGFGFVAGVLYRSMLNGRILGLTFYPSVFVGCLEIMRVTYLNGSRAVLIVVGSTAAYLQVRSARARMVKRRAYSQSSRPF